MKIELDIKKLESNGKDSIPLRVKIKVECVDMKIGEKAKMVTEYIHPQGKTYAYLEKNTIDIGEERPAYIEVIVLDEENKIVAQRTVFCTKFKELNTLKLTCEDNATMLLRYLCRQLAADAEDYPTPIELFKGNTENQEESLEATGKLELIKMSVQLFNFCQRLDPLIALYNYSIDLLFWKHPIRTLALGCLLTLMIFNIKMSVLIGGILLAFCRRRLISKLEQFHKYRNNHRRIMIPNENILFLVSIIESYSQLYQKSTEFLFNDDKGVILFAIQLLCKFGLVIILLLGMFGLEGVIAIALWTGLALTSPFSHILIKHGRPLVNTLLSEYARIEHIVKKTLKGVIPTSRIITEDIKEFYYYEYERWWVLKEWLPSNNPYSDEENECRIVPKKEAPIGWVWVEDWRISFAGNVDANGYEYTNDFLKTYSCSPIVATVRRKKWKRICVRGKEKAL